MPFSIDLSNITLDGIALDGGMKLALEFLFLSLFLVLGNLLKRKVKFFQKFLFPTSIIAGFIGLILGKEVLGIVIMDSKDLTSIVYHLMAVGFIALALKDRGHKKHNAGKTGVFIVSNYLMQGILGFVITLVLAYTILPDIFPPMGLLLPLGYGQGPGAASSIGSQWEALGFTNGSSLGLSIATMGFLWACFGGIFLMNYLIKVKKMKPIDTVDKVEKEAVEFEKPGDIPLSDSIDRITVQLFLIGFVYLFTFAFLYFLSKLLGNLGGIGNTIAQLFWGLHFTFGTIFAIGLRKIFDYWKKKKIMNRNYPNNYLLQRISGGSFDYLVTAAICAISIDAIKEYWLPFTLVAVLGGLATMIYIVKMSKRIYGQYQLENILGMYGMMTGTISTGMALIREVDPNFKTNAAEHLVFGSATALPLGIPLMVLLSIPVTGYSEGNELLYFIGLGAFVVYMIGLLAILLIKRRKNRG